MALNKIQKNDATEVLRKRARNVNAFIIIVLLYYTLDLDLRAISISGMAIIKIENEKNIVVWIYTFLGYYSLRYMQEYYFGGSAFSLKDENKLVKSKFKKVSWEDNRIRRNFPNGDYLVNVESPNKTDRFVVILSTRRIIFFKIILWFPTFINTLFIKPKYLTVHLPFLGFLVLGVYFTWFH